MTFAPRSVRMRLTLWYAAALALIVVLFAGSVYALVAWSLQRQGRQQLDEALVAVEKAHGEGVHELEEIDHHGSVTYFHVVTHGSVVYQSDAWRRHQLSDALAIPPGHEAAPFESPSGEHFLVRSRALSGVQPPVTLAAAISLRLPRQSLQTLAVTLVVGLPLAILIAAAGGYWLAGRALAPVTAITAKAREITAERLGERLPVANPDDEFGQLATAFNAVLARLHDSFDRLERFTSDASHELRTPLTVIRSVGEVALNGSLPPQQYRDVIGSMLEEADRLARLLDSLLTLTRADNERISVRRRRVDAAALTRESGELLRSLAEERGQTLTIDAATPLPVEADPNVLRQALINFLDNAVKYTPREGAIRVTAGLSPRDEAVIEVCDSGPGIAVEHQQKVFDRFYRVDKARARETGGVGLGLALAKWAVEINAGRIELESEPGKGSRFRIVLPGQAALQRNGESVEPCNIQGEGVNP